MASRGVTGSPAPSNARLVTRLRSVTSFTSWTTFTALVFAIGLLAAGGLAYYRYVTAQEVSQAKRNFRHLEQLARNLAEAVAAYEKMLDPYLEVPTLVQIASHPVYEEKIAPRTTQCFNHVPVRYEGRFASHQGKTRETWRPLADQNTGLDNPIDPSPEPPKDLQWLGGWLFFMLRSFCGEGSIIDDIWLSIEQPEREFLSLQSNPRDNRGDVPEMLLKGRWRLDSVTKEALTYLAPSVVQSRVEYRMRYHL